MMICVTSIYEEKFAADLFSLKKNLNSSFTGTKKCRTAYFNLLLLKKKLLLKHLCENFEEKFPFV